MVWPLLDSADGFYGRFLGLWPAVRGTIPMDIGRATNCDLWLTTPPGGVPCLGPRTSSAVRVGVYADALAAQGVTVVVADTKNPCCPLPEEAAGDLRL